MTTEEKAVLVRKLGEQYITALENVVRLQGLLHEATVSPLESGPAAEAKAEKRAARRKAADDAMAKKTEESKVPMPEEAQTLKVEPKEVEELPIAPPPAAPVEVDEKTLHAKLMEYMQKAGEKTDAKTGLAKALEVLARYGAKRVADVAIDKRPAMLAEVVKLLKELG